MKKMQFFMCALLAGAMMFTACEKKGGNGEIVIPDNEEEVVLEDAPSIAAPEAGKTTIAIRVPAGTCGGVVAVGDNGGELAWDPGKGVAFAKVEGTETWFAVTLNHSADMALKAIAGTEEGKYDWGTQWGGLDNDGNALTAILDGVGEFEVENSVEHKLKGLADASVVYIDIAAWKSAPCTPKNEAGSATFTMTAPALPEGCEVYIVGNFTEENWNWGSAESTPTHKMEFADGKYTHTADVPATFEYKYFYKTADGTMSWDNSEDGGNRAMALDLKPVDEVTAWKGAAVAQ